MEDLARGLAVVVGLAEALEVGPVEEELGVAAVRLDMVDDGRRGEEPLALTRDAEGMLLEETLPQALPAGGVVEGDRGLVLPSVEGTDAPGLAGGAPAPPHQHPAPWSCALA